jgi:hypothetical protein
MAAVGSMLSDVSRQPRPPALDLRIHPTRRAACYLRKSSYHQRRWKFCLFNPLVIARRSMARNRMLLCAVSVLAGMPVAALAHHSFAMFDRGRTDTIVGAVKQFEMINPHGWLRVDVVDAQGRANEWSLEAGGPGQMQRQGWTQTTVRPGDTVTVRIHPLRDGSYGGQLVSVTLPDGKVLGEPPRPQVN